MNGNPPGGLPRSNTAVPPRPIPGAAPPARPPNAPSGTNPLRPNGPPRPRGRKRPQADPMRPLTRPLKQIAKSTVSNLHMNEKSKAAAANEPSDKDVLTVEQARQQFLAQGAISVPLVVTRGDLVRLRHHVMRLQQVKGREVDVMNQEQFVPPIRLHRRDPRAPPSGAGSHFVEEDTKEDLEEQQERERIEIAKEERRKIREENQAKIAPTSKKPPAFQKKTEQKFRPDDTPEAEKRRLLRYEETLPWHLEDFENKQTWVGTYESELSEAHIMLTTAYNSGRDVFQMVPLERWYRFNTKGKVQTHTVEEAEAAVKKENYTPTFFKGIEKASMKIKEEESKPKGGSRMRTRVGGGDDDEGAAPRRRPTGSDDAPTYKREADADDIDFNLEDDFADDEEGLNGLFEGDEADVKDAAEKVKRDMLAANAFELRDDNEVWREEERREEEARAQKELEKSLRKALMKREKNLDYATDDSNPYASSSESESDSEIERQKLKEEEEKKAAEQNKNKEGDKTASGTTTKGTTTPSGAHKPVDINKKKRPGSPNLSEASGNESTRKKKKKHHDPSRKASLAVMGGPEGSSRRGAASGSESEMTEGGKKKKQKLILRPGGSPTGTPGGSRAGSPAAQMNGSRAGSPAAGASQVRAQNQTQSGLPSAHEIWTALPKEGMMLNVLTAQFKNRVPKEHTKTFITMVKAVSDFNPHKRCVMPKEKMPSDAEVDAAIRKSTQPKSAAAPAASPAA